MKNKNLFLWLGLTVPGLLFVIFVVSSISIGTGVQEIINEARDLHQGNRIESLIHFMESEEIPVSKRNRAVWALGQMGESRALPFLIKHSLSEEEHSDQALSRHELKKAIKLCKGGWNITAWTWRRFVK